MIFKNLVTWVDLAFGSCLVLSIVVKIIPIHSGKSNPTLSLVILLDHNLMERNP